VRVALGLDRSNFVLLGHSWGGILATEYALAHQEHLRGLVISTKWQEYPDIPTLAELGYAQPLFGVWTAFFAPAGVPQDVIRVLVPALERAIRSPALVARLRPLGIAVDYESPERLQAEIRDEHQRVAEMASQAGVLK